MRDRYKMTYRKDTRRNRSSSKLQAGLTREPKLRQDAIAKSLAAVGSGARVDFPVLPATSCELVDEQRTLCVLHAQNRAF